MAATTVAGALREAVADHQAGRLVEAEAGYRRILAQFPQHPDALHMLGLLAHQSGNHDAALDLIGQALRQAPGHAPCHANLGDVLRSMGRLDEAMASCRRALALQPGLPEAHNNLGNALQAKGRVDEAIDCFRHALALRPAFAEAHNNLGFALYAGGRPEEAVASLHRALALRPDFVEALNNLGLSLQAIGRSDEAIDHLQRAVQLRPDYAEAHNNLAAAQAASGMLDAAVSSYQRALQIRPHYAEAHSNLGLALEAQGKADAAIGCYHRAQAIQPGFAPAYLNESLALLRMGDFEAGWPLYEWRLQALGNQRLVREFAQPLWLGDAPVAGRRILLHHEQGLGDTLQMLRYVPVLARQGARVMVQVPPVLAAISRTVPGIEQVIIEGEAIPAFDLQCPIMSLPLACRTRLSSIPADTPYLFAPEPVRAIWAERLGPRARRRIGLAWSGSAGHRNDRHRSIALRRLLPLLELDAEFHSLQKEYRAGDEEWIRGDGRIGEHAGWLGDLADTAGLIGQMDLVITVDTAVAHLAGAVGAPVWLLLPADSDYRWLLDRDDSPWYPTMRLFRQRKVAAWEPVIAAVARALACGGPAALVSGDRGPDERL